MRDFQIFCEKNHSQVLLLVVIYMVPPPLVVIRMELPLVVIHMEPPLVVIHMEALLPRVVPPKAAYMVLLRTQVVRLKEAVSMADPHLMVVLKEAASTVVLRPPLEALLLREDPQAPTHMAAHLRSLRCSLSL